MTAKGILISLLLFSAMGIAHAAGSAQSTNAVRLVGMPPKVHNRAITSFTEGNKTALHLDARDDDGLGWWPDLKFANGTIEFSVRGTNVLQKSFVGVAFHGLDETTFDAVYLRPFNFGSDDPVRRSHGVQYIAQPTYTWNKLRDEFPNKYEHEVSPAPDPNGWVKVRIVVKHPKVQVFINGETKPSLEVEQLSQRKSGWVGIWVGNGSGGDFANLKITAENNERAPSP